MTLTTLHQNLNRPAAELPESLSVPSAIVILTNRCNLKCDHCFVFRDANHSLPIDEPSDDELLEQIETLAKKHGISMMLWMGGEPLIRKKLLRRGLSLFTRNTITTNGTIPLEDFSDVDPNMLYVVSLDGPEELNDAIRGKGVFRRVLHNMSKLPDDFPHVVQCQCTVTKRNQNALGDLLDSLRGTAFNHMTFNFHVPGADDYGEDAWATLEERDAAVRTVMRLKEESGGFVRNRSRSLEMMLSENDPKSVTDNCLSGSMALPLYLKGKTLVTPFCCYGNDVDCDRCGSWAVFEMAVRYGAGFTPPSLSHQ